jgi:rod shape-determining protein MreC
MMTSNLTRKLIYGIMACTLLLFIVQRTFFFKHGFLDNLSAVCIYPFLVVSSKISKPFQDFLRHKLEYHELEARYHALEKEYTKLVSHNVAHEAMLHRNALTKDLVMFQERYNLEHGILGKILVKHFTPREHSLIVNKGSMHGIKKDMIAIYDAQLVGRVHEAFPYFSKIIVLSDPSCKVASYLSGSSVSGIAIGSGKVNECLLEYVSHLMTIKNHDLVISSGEGLIFPEGFCIGRVIEDHIEGLCHSITIKPIIDFTKLEFCVLLDRSLLSTF